MAIRIVMIRPHISCGMNSNRNSYRTTTMLELLKFMVWDTVFKDSPPLFIVQILPSGLPVVMFSPLFGNNDLRVVRIELTLDCDPIVRTVIATWSDVDALVHDLWCNMSGC